MYKIMTLAMLLVGLALAPVLSGMELPGSFHLSQESVDYAVEIPQADEAEAEVEDEVEAKACSWTCQACEPDQGCSQICTESGECGSVCGVVARCDAQYRWDENLCACVTR